MTQLVLQTQSSGVPNTVSDQRETITVIQPDGTVTVIPTEGLLRGQIDAAVAAATEYWEKDHALERIRAGDLTNANGTSKAPMRSKAGDSTQWDTYDVNFSREELENIGQGNYEAGKKIAREAVEAWASNCMVPGYPGKRTAVIQDWHEQGETPHLRLSVSRIVYPTPSQCHKMVGNKSDEKNADMDAWARVMKAVGLPSTRINYGKNYFGTATMATKGVSQAAPQPTTAAEKSGDEIGGEEVEEEFTIPVMKIPPQGMTGGVYAGSRQTLEDQVLYDRLREVSEREESAAREKETLQAMIAERHANAAMKADLAETKSILHDTTIERDRYKTAADAVSLELDAALEKYSTEKMSWSALQEEYDNRLKEAVQENTHLEAENKDLETDLAFTTKLTREWSDRYTEQGAQIEAVKKQLAAAEADRNKLAEQLEVSNKSVAELTEISKDLNAEIEKLKVESRTKDQVIQDMQDRHEKRIAEMQEQIKDLTIAEGAAKFQYDMIKEKMDKVQKEHEPRIEMSKHIRDTFVENQKAMGIPQAEIDRLDRDMEKNDMTRLCKIFDETFGKLAEKREKYGDASEQLLLKDKELQTIKTEYEEQISSLTKSNEAQARQIVELQDMMGSLEKKVGELNQGFSSIAAHLAIKEGEAKELRTIATNLIQQQQALVGEVNAGRDLAGVARIEMEGDQVIDTSGKLPVMQIPALPIEHSRGNDPEAVLINNAVKIVKAAAQKVAQEQIKNENEPDEPTQGGGGRKK